MNKLLYIFFVALCCTLSVQAQNTNNLWVNEFHYDGTSSFTAAPANEFVELIVHNDIVNNPVELAKYQLVLYSAGASVVDENTAEAVKGLPYDKSSRLYSAADTYHTLDGFQVCDVADRNYSVLSKELPVLQDLPSGMGLIYNNSVVVQLVSYEKRFKIKDAAEAGPAAGMLTEMMGSATVAENSSSSNMTSMQLGRGASGNNYAAFSWSSGNTASPCALNNGQEVGNLEAVVINDALAVEMIDFVGEAQEESITLNWRTANEQNNKGFYVERRADNEAEFTAIDFVAGQGNANATQHYSYIDTDVTAGQVYYYRLQQVDQNNQKTTSNTIALRMSGTSVYLNAMPNPAKGAVNIRLENIRENAVLQVTTMEGKVLKTINLAAAKVQSYNLSVESLSTGFYILRVESGQDVLTQKLSVL